MNWKQRALANLMSEISEDCYCAGWMHGLEFALWAIATGDRKNRKYGQGEVSQQQIDDLMAISAEIGGWIRWADDESDPGLSAAEWGEVFVPMDEWMRIYKKVTGEM
jgi:hypothetical protein